MACTEIQNVTLRKIKAKLETERAFDLGMSIRGSVRRSTNSICFNFPAPVVSGACGATITVYADGSVYDSTSETKFDDFAAWEAEFEETCQFGEERNDLRRIHRYRTTCHRRSLASYAWRGCH